MDEFINYRDVSRPHLCSGDYGASFFTAVGEYASSAYSSIGEYLGSLSAADYLGYAGTALSAAGYASGTAGEASRTKAEAKALEDQADLIDAETQFERRAQQRRVRQVLGRNRATAGASGVSPFTGTPLEVELSNQFEAGLNDSLISFAGGERARQARLGASYARNSVPGIIFGGLASGAGASLSNWYRLSKPRQTATYPTRASSFDSSWGG